MKKPTMRYRCRCCNPQSAGEAPRHDRRQLMMGLMALAALPMLGACDKEGEKAIYVEGSSRLGSMGPTFGSFSNEEDAKAFIAKYGGKLLHMKDITPEMVDLRGGANMDHSM